MKQIVYMAILSFASLLIACSNKVYPTNGETIYKTGRNLNGEKLLDKKASRIKFANSCVICHGKKGDRIEYASIRFKDLSNPEKYDVAYNDSLFYRFLDHDLKSDGSKANIGVIWKMSLQDKKDLLDYLKSI